MSESPGREARRRWQAEWWVALVAALSGLLGAGVGAGVAYLTTNQQLAAQERVSKDAAHRDELAYLRGLRRGYYEGVNKAAYACHDYLADFYDDIADGAGQPSLRRDLKLATNEYGKLRNAVSDVDLVGNAKVADAAREVLDAAAKGLSPKLFSRAVQEPRGQHKAWDAASADYLQKQAVLVLQIRADLGVNTP